MTVLCPKCKKTVYIPDNKDFAYCSCGELVIVIPLDFKDLIKEIVFDSKELNAVYN
jgi:hypothetical protein